MLTPCCYPEQLKMLNLLPYRFDFAFGLPAAYIMSQLYGEKVDFQLMPSVKQHEGLPYFVVSVQSVSS